VRDGRRREDCSTRAWWLKETIRQTIDDCNWFHNRAASVLKNTVFTTEDTEDTEKKTQKLLCDLCDLRGNYPNSKLL